MDTVVAFLCMPVRRFRRSVREADKRLPTQVNIAYRSNWACRSNCNRSLLGAIDFYWPTMSVSTRSASTWGVQFDGKYHCLVHRLHNHDFVEPETQSVNRTISARFTYDNYDFRWSYKMIYILFNIYIYTKILDNNTSALKKYKI